MKNPFTRRRAAQALPQANAEQILANVFMLCQREPNSVPLEALTAYSNYRKERYAMQRSVIVAMLALFLLLPLLFFAAGISVLRHAPQDGENPVYTVSVDTKIPIRQIEAYQGDRAVPMYEVAPGEYTVMPLVNGEMRILVTLVNRQATDMDVDVQGVDKDAPALVSTSLSGETVLFYLEDASGVDYAGITVTDPDGWTVAPVHVDEAAGCVTLPYPKEALHVRIPDVRGNVLDVNLKPQQ